MFFFYFSLVFVYSISYVYYANILFYVFLIKDVLISNGRFKLIPNKMAKIFLLLFVFWVTLSTFSYALYKDSLDLRTIIQYIFTIQYIVLIIAFKIDFELLKRWIYRFSILLSAIIVAYSVFLMFYTSNFSPRILYNNDFAYMYFPGWPNTTPIPLLFSLLIALRNREHLISKILLVSGLVLTISRGAYLGVILIIAYYGYEQVMSSREIMKFVIVGMLITIFVGGFWVSNNPLFVSQMLRSYDRVDIYNTTMEYVKLNPIIGYGGNTIDQLQHVKIDYVPVKNWGHTHNWVLETLLRYGIVGLSIFVGFVVSLWVKIGDRDRKFLFAVFIFLALFQTFIRDFVFIFYLAYLSNDSNESLTIKKQCDTS